MPPEIASFAARINFPLDEFQVEACRSLVAGRGVLVAAPTGAGKTIVADFAVYLAVQSPRDKIFYTTPIKALSNQKFSELVATYGADQVGLLTGDTNVNPTARILVMTTEVLRNMIYAGSTLLTNLSYVVMDEVHYLADRFRGPVWEEVIIQLPQSVRIISLSATVSNAEEFGAWLQEVRGDTDVIVSEYRPVPLQQHVLVGHELVDLFVTNRASDATEVNPILQRLDSRPRSRGRGAGHRDAPRHRKADRPQVVALLAQQNMLPAIFFIFSRVGCDAAVSQCLVADVQLTNAGEQKEIRKVARARCADIPAEDLRVLGYHAWLRGLERGVAAHHAGMLPAFKEVVEELFRRKLVKAVFATETLALGINMPARSVVLERLDKFNGISRVQITPGEYTQLTGRAGRRGIDHEGHAVIQWRPENDVEHLESLATKRTYPLYSRFRPTYNMAVNLIDQHGREQTRQILETSFAQFQADRSVVGVAAQIRDIQASMSGFEASFACERGDFGEYASLRRRQHDLEAELAKAQLRGRKGRKASLQKQIDRVKHDLRQHSCHSCPEREQHARWAERWWRLKRKSDLLTKQLRGSTGNIARIYHRVIQILGDLGYLSMDNAGNLTTTAKGSTLKRIYGERDLLVAEAVDSGLWSALDTATLGAIVSTLVYEPRRDQGEQASYPRGEFTEVYEATTTLWATLDDLEVQGGMPGTTKPSAELARAVHAWANGATLERVLNMMELSAGDFVRIMKQVVDLLDQIAQVADGRLATTAEDAIERCRRGIIDYARSGE